MSTYRLANTLFLAIILTTFCAANENSVFLYNRIETCKTSEYYDINYFVCRECDPQLNLVPAANGESSTRLQIIIE